MLILSNDLYIWPIMKNVAPNVIVDGDPIMKILFMWRYRNKIVHSTSENMIIIFLLIFSCLMNKELTPINIASKNSILINQNPPKRYSWSSIVNVTLISLHRNSCHP